MLLEEKWRADVAACVGPYSPQRPLDHLAQVQEAAQEFNLVPVYVRLTSDQLTPVTAYRCLVPNDDFESPSFLFESVQNGTDTGRFSFVAAQPSLEILAQGNDVTVLDHRQVCSTLVFTHMSAEAQHMCSLCNSPTTCLIISPLHQSTAAITMRLPPVAARKLPQQAQGDICILLT